MKNKTDLFDMAMFFRNFIGPECPYSLRLVTKSNNKEAERERIISIVSTFGTVVFKRD